MNNPFNGPFLWPNDPFRLFSHHIFCPMGPLKEWFFLRYHPFKGCFWWFWVKDAKERLVFWFSGYHRGDCQMHGWLRGADRTRTKTEPCLQKPNTSSNRKCSNKRKRRRADGVLVVVACACTSGDLGVLCCIGAIVAQTFLKQDQLDGIIRRWFGNLRRGIVWERKN